MNSRELVDYIRSGPALLVLNNPLRFRRRTRSNPCGFSDFIHALQSSETIRTALCGPHLELGITEHEWDLIVKTLGSIKDIRNLNLYCTDGSCNFHPFQAVAEAVNSAHSLRKLTVGLAEDRTFPRDSSGLTALISALRKHTGLQEFHWIDLYSRVQLEAVQSAALDPVLKALAACPHLRNVVIATAFASGDAIRNLLQLPTKNVLRLDLTPDHWLTVADEIRQGRCHRKILHLGMLQCARSETTEAIKAVASAIRWDRYLEVLVLQMEDGYTDEAGVALAEALTTNKKLRLLRLVDILNDLNPIHTKACLGAQAYEAFSAMLRVNTSLFLNLPPFETAGADERLRESRKQMRIEQRLNHVGRGRLLSSSQTTRTEWVGALNELNSSDNVDESPELNISCLYSLLRLKPSVCLLDFHGLYRRTLDEGSSGW
jgi:hypothetical protein